MFNGKLLQLQQSLKSLPGIGEKTAQRLALYILSQN
ncbi:MAG: recombination protein RecR, partial [Candidatus Cloacimonetes bacterium]|nr:recombination protein RecR [Candidatus Cloacimonadota bacterium]